MKRYIFILITAAFLFLIMGCEKLPVGNDFLEKPPSVDITSDTIFSNLVYAQRYLFAGYLTLNYGIPYNASDRNVLNYDPLEAVTDFNHGYISWTGANQYYQGTYTPANENGVVYSTKYGWNRPLKWNGIRIGYNFLENADQIKDADVNTKKLLKAEARMIIAMHYADMYRYFGGGLPWVGHSIGVSEDMKFPRLTSLATLDSILVLIDKAIPDLPWSIVDKSNWDGRFTQAGAMGLKARILLFAASPILNDVAPYLDGEAAQKKMTWHGRYDVNMWKKAADAAKELISKAESNGGYSLVKTGNPRQDFQYAYTKRANSEILISTRIEYRCDVSLAWGCLWHVRNGTGNPTFTYSEMFPMANGLPITNPASGYNPADPYLKRDPRLYETILVNGDIYQGRTAELWIGGRERVSAATVSGASGQQVRKFLLDYNTATSMGAVTQWPYLRLAEIYLGYAEALNEYAGGPNAEAYKYVNLVRNRVNLGDLPAGLNKEQFRQAILTERGCEFGYEEVRWFDLVRWKMENDFKKPLFGMNITKVGTQFTYKKVPMPIRYWATNWSPKWYFNAFPPDEVIKGFGLVQNPGWE